MDSPLRDMENNKSCLFQYATRQKIIEDTELITREQAEDLWSKYYKDIIDEWDILASPQMCIWIDCKSNTDYHTVGKEIDFRDCELKNGRFYKVEKKLIQ